MDVSDVKRIEAQLAKKICPQCLEVVGNKTISCKECKIEYCGLLCWIDGRQVHKIICAARKCDRYRKFANYTVVHSGPRNMDKIVLTKPTRVRIGKDFRWRNLISDNRSSPYYINCAICGQGSMFLYEIGTPEFLNSGFATRKLIRITCGNHTCKKEIRNGIWCDCWLDSGIERTTIYIEVIYYTCSNCNHKCLLEGTYMTIVETILYLFTCVRKIGINLPLDIRKMLGWEISLTISK
jgi:hypothetical protein